MEYKFKGFFVNDGDFSEVEKWVNEMAKKGFEVDSLETELIGNGKLDERVVVVMKKGPKVVDFPMITNPDSIQIVPLADAKEVAKVVEEKVKQETKGKGKSK